MAFVEWNAALEIGVAEIDYQHRNLVSMLNALQHAIESGEAREHLAEILEELDLYVINHFATEERVMDRIHYEHAPQHRAEHQQLAETVHQHRLAFARGEGSADELQQFLIRWLLQHIAGSDGEIGAAYRNASGAVHAAG